MHEYLNKLKQLKPRAFSGLKAKIFVIVNSLFRRTFTSCLKSGDLLESSSVDILSYSFLDHLDQGLNYFLFHASFADKWFILSFLGDHFYYYPKSRVLAANEDKPLVDLFLGSKCAAQRFIFMDKEIIASLSTIFRPVSRVSMPIADTWYAEGCQHTLTPYFLANGLPSCSIRHLHIVYYPYFSDLFLIHGVPYSKLLRMLLYLPAHCKPAQPSFYTDDDFREATILSAPRDARLGTKTALFNIVNFSHKSFSLSQLCLICSLLESHAFHILINTAQSDATSDVAASFPNSRYISFIDVPPRLLALVSQNADVVIGALGGAMNIAAQYSQTHMLSLETSAVGYGCDEDELCGEWGKERIWEWYDQDWNCIVPGRLIENIFIGDPAECSNQRLVEIVELFLDRLAIYLISS